MKILGGACMVSLVIGTVWAQSTPAKLEFEVASVKPAGPLDPQKILVGQAHIGVKIDGSQVDLGMLSLNDLLPIAFRVKPYQIAGPDWLGQNRFDIRAKLPEGATADQMPDMLQALLVDRFKLTFHRENRDHPVYALVVAKGGSKLKPGVDEPEPPIDEKAKSFALPSLDGTQGRVTQTGNGFVVRGGVTGTMRATPGADGVHLEASSMTIAVMIETIARFVDRPIIDTTELKGKYQIKLDISLSDVMQMMRTSGLGMPQLPAGVNLPGADGPSSIFNGLQELGLKLEPRKLPVETIVVEHVERLPTDN